MLTLSEQQELAGLTLCQGDLKKSQRLLSLINKVRAQLKIADTAIEDCLDDNNDADTVFDLLFIARREMGKVAAT